MPPTLSIQQPSLPGFCPITDAVQRLSSDSGAGERGAVFTRIEVVNFMLDLAGYTDDRPLHTLRLLEPSFGGGEFLLEAVKRLLRAHRNCGSTADLLACICGVELHEDSYEETSARLRRLLLEMGVATANATRWISNWLLHGDFLLTDLPGKFDVVVGNPPYVRQELIPAALLAEYRRQYTSLYDRADLYVPFIERSLGALTQGGQLAFICADRWTKNRYGGPLRGIVSSGFHLRAYVDMVGTAAFASDVTAYPAITLIERAEPGATRVAQRPVIEAKYLAELARKLRDPDGAADAQINVVANAVNRDSPWVLSSSPARALLRRLEAAHPLLESAGCKVGIGVATGADAAFIAPLEALDVEPTRKLALATTRDISSGRVQWLGLGVINPFEDDGSLVDLDLYPRLSRHLEAHRDLIAGRHVARRTPAKWYRTIDRITPSLAACPKLLIPDIKGSAHVVFEDGKLYPHHNLYYVTSGDWDLHALQAVLLSSVTRLFIRSYSTTMRGGFLRYQAQYLRRIRLPHWADVHQSLREELILAAQALSLERCNVAAAKLYGLTEEECALLADPVVEHGA